MSANKELYNKTIEILGHELMNPYLIYEMAIGGGCTEQQAKVEMMLYCKEVGVTNSHVQGLSAL